MTIHGHPIIAVKLAWGWHYAIRARDPFGTETLISLRGRKNCVTEEPWYEVIGGSPWRYAAEIQPAIPYFNMLQLARSRVGAHGYDLFNYNCEHFVRWSAGLKVESKQVEMAAIALGVSVLLAGGMALSLR